MNVQALNWGDEGIDPSLPQKNSAPSLHSCAGLSRHAWRLGHAAGANDGLKHRTWLHHQLLHASCKHISVVTQASPVHALTQARKQALPLASHCTRPASTTPIPRTGICPKWACAPVRQRAEIYQAHRVEYIKQRVGYIKPIPPRQVVTLSSTNWHPTNQKKGELVACTSRRKPEAKPTTGSEVHHVEKVCYISKLPAVEHCKEYGNTP